MGSMANQGLGPTTRLQACGPAGMTSSPAQVGGRSAPIARHLWLLSTLPGRERWPRTPRHAHHQPRCGRGLGWCRRQRNLPGAKYAAWAAAAITWRTGTRKCCFLVYFRDSCVIGLFWLLVMSLCVWPTSVKRGLVSSLTSVVLCVRRLESKIRWSWLWEGYRVWVQTA